MSQEEKSLLLKDLSARLPYGVIGEYSWKGRVPYNRELTGNLYDELNSSWNSTEDSKFIPYLRPMSSITEEEKKEYDSFLFDNLEREDVIGYEDKAFGIDVIMRYRSWQVVQWLLKHHLDFNGLIDVYGLSLEAPEGMYKF